MSVLRKYTDYLSTYTSTTGQQVLKCYVEQLQYWPNKKRRASLLSTNENTKTKVNTKHCVPHKQAALQIPLAGSCSSANFGCQAVYAAKTTHLVKTQHENIVSLIRLNLIYCELIFCFPKCFWSFSWRGDLDPIGINPSTSVLGPRIICMLYRWHLSGVVVG
jgi:hypothetical protein